MYTVQCIHVCVQRYHYSYVDTIAIDHFLYISCTSVPPQNPDIYTPNQTHRMPEHYSIALWQAIYMVYWIDKLHHKTQKWNCNECQHTIVCVLIHAETNCGKDYILVFIIIPTKHIHWQCVQRYIFYT